MAHPPPRAPVAPALTEEEKLAALEVAHSAEVAELDRVLSASLKGKNAPAGLPVLLSMPLGDHSPRAISDVEALFVEAGWKSATVKDGCFALVP